MGLKEIVLNALVEPKGKGEWLGPSKIRYIAGIDHHLIAANPQKNFKNFFVRALLFKLREDGRVLGEEKGPIRNGKPTLVWQLTDAEFQKHQIDATQKLDVETYIEGIEDTVLDVLVETRGKKEEAGMSLKVITERTGILQQLEGTEESNMPRNFTYALLISLRNHGCVEKHGHGYKTFWTVTDRIFQIHQKR